MTSQTPGGSSGETRGELGHLPGSHTCTCMILNTARISIVESVQCGVWEIAGSILVGTQIVLL